MNSVSPEQLGALVLGALLLFWAVGAHNRLVALRNAVGTAWVKIAAAAAQRAAAAAPLPPALMGPLAAEHRALDAFTAALADSTRAGTALAIRPLDAAAAAAWTACEAALSAAASRVFALIDQHAGLCADATVAQAAAAWRDAAARIAFARQVYNDAAAAHDAAIAMFPTRLLVPLFGFKAAGRV